MSNALVREKIFDLFRNSKCKVGHMVPMRTISNVFLRQQIDYTPVVKELISENLVEYKGDNLPGLFLTQKGYDHIYTLTPDSQLKQMVLNLFINTNCKVGQGYMYRTLDNAVISKLNPKDRDRIFIVLDKMIDDDEITVSFENDYPLFVKLTEKGYSLIHQ